MNTSATEVASLKKLLVTSALPYANGPIHLGHLVEYIQTDIFVRYWRLRGRDVIYLCADDTHGTPVMLRAAAEGIDPAKLVERVWHEHRRDFDGFLIQFDNYYTTHSEENRELSAEIYQRLHENGHIAERTIEQSYCNQCKLFLPDRLIRGTCPNCGAEDQYGDACEVCSTTYTPRELRDPYCAKCGMTPGWRESEHLFFKLGDFADRLREWLAAGHVQEEIANKLQEWFQIGLADWDISRDAPYFGFEIPGKPGKYFYVWLDAPVGYMAATLNWCRQHRPLDSGAAFDSYWRDAKASEVYHFIGKDIIYFHALFWPAMLLGAGLRTPSQLCVHGFLTINGKKMSKSRGTFITAETYLKHLEPQYLRYYYATKLGPRVEDIDLSLDDFVQRVNADLVNKIANIPSRVLAILHRNCGGRLGGLDDGGRELVGRCRARVDEVAGFYERREFGQVTRVLGELTSDINGYLQEHKPWQLAKEGAEGAAQVVCTAALNAFRIVATLLAPIQPRTAELVAKMLRLPSLAWEGLDELLEDVAVEPYERLADRVDPQSIAALVEASQQTSGIAEEVAAPTMTLDALVDCELQTQSLVEAHTVPESDKLLSLAFEGPEGRRQIVAGLGHAALEAGLAGHEYLVLANLQPKKLRGLESQGMLLAGDVDGQPLPVRVVNTQRRTIVD